MALSLPGRVLALGTNLADPYPSRSASPQIVDLSNCSRSTNLIPPAPDDCAASDWSDLHQRMHYISHLFRAFHLDDALTRPPFTPEQVASFDNGVVPDGDL